MLETPRLYGQEAKLYTYLFTDHAQNPYFDHIASILEMIEKKTGRTCLVGGDDYLLKEWFFTFFHSLDSEGKDFLQNISLDEKQYKKMFRLRGMLMDFYRKG
ncbi:hypothetical protein [Geoalkalibacter halelectricus]|uniref:hypothetical protein n=1 Tax=Geoalkalibacter halelectricus TaxID=2847045 RepID=UPI003D240527